jgi:hypothetical protein
MKCPTCPVPIELACPREGVRRVCDLCNPDHPDHDPVWPPYLRQLANLPASSPIPHRPDVATSCGGCPGYTFYSRPADLRQ